MQTDGNLVLYHKSDGRALWAAENTYGSGATDVVMQGGDKIKIKIEIWIKLSGLQVWLLGWGVNKYNLRFYTQLLFCSPFYFINQQLINMLKKLSVKLLRIKYTHLLWQLC